MLLLFLLSSQGGIVGLQKVLALLYFREGESLVAPLPLALVHGYGGGVGEVKALHSPAMGILKHLLRFSFKMS